MKTLLDKMDNAICTARITRRMISEFHSMIAQCTGNDVMMRLLPTIHESIQAGYHHTRRVGGQLSARKPSAIWRVYRGILEHDSERARAGSDT